MELDALKFTVETTALDDAITKVGTLQLAVKKLGSETGSQSARQAAKEQAQITLDQVKAETALIEARGKQARAIEKSNEAQEKQNNSTKNSTSILEKYESILKLVADGSTRGNAGILQMAQAAGVSDTEFKTLKTTLEGIKTIIGGDPFDKSNSALKALTDRNKLATVSMREFATDTTMTMKQVQGLTLDLERQRKSHELNKLAIEESTKQRKILISDYIREAELENTLTASAKAHAEAISVLNKARQDEEAWIKRTNKELENSESKRINSIAKDFEDAELVKQKAILRTKAIQDSVERKYELTNSLGFSKSEASAIYNFEQQIKKTGETLDVSKAKVEAFMASIREPAKATADPFAKEQALKAKAVEKSANDQVKALAKADEMLARLQNRTKEMSKESPVSATAANQLYAYEKALRAAGVGADDATARLAVFRAEQQKVSQLARAEETLRMQHLSRALAPQVTDVTVGLMTGQNPFTVFLQQGGQIRDQIGLSQVAVENLGKVFKDTFVMMGAMVAGMGRALYAFFLTPVGAAVLALSAFAIGMYEAFQVMVDGEEKTLALNKALIMFGNSAGLTVNSLKALSKEAATVDGISVGKSTEAMTALAKAGGLTSDEFVKAAQSAVLLERYAGVSLDKTADAFKALSKEPLKAIEKLNEETGFFSDTIVAQVAELERLGKKEEAGALAKDAYAAATIKASNDIKDSLTGFGKFLDTAGNEWNRFWERVTGKNVKVDFGSKIKEIDDKIAEINASRTVLQAGGMNITIPSPMADREVQGLLATRGDLVYKRASENAKAEAQQRQTDLGHNQMDIDKLTNKHMITVDTKTTEINKAIELYNKSITNALSNPETFKNVASFIEKRDKLIHDIQTGKKGDPKAKEEKSDSLSFSLANDTAQARKQYDIQLKDQTDFVNQQKQRLDNSLAAKEISQGEFIAREIALVMKGEAEQSKIIEDSMVKEQENYAKDRASLTQQYKDWQAENKGMPDFVDVNKQKAEELQSKLGDLTNTFNSATEKLMASSDKVKETAFTRMIKQISELKGAIREVILEREKFQRSEDELLSKQKRQTAIEDKLRYASPEQAAFIQAQSQEQERLNAVIKVYNEELAKADINLKGYNAALVSEQDPEIIKRLQEQIVLMGQANEERRKSRDLVLGSIDEKALVQAQNAQLKYQKDQMKALSDSVAGALEEGLYKGGAVGAKSLRNIIEAELRKPITIFIRAIVGDIFGGVGGDTAGGGLAGSSGGNGLGALYKMYDTFSNGFTNLSNGVTNTLNSFSTSGAGSSLGLSTSQQLPVPYATGEMGNVATANASAGAAALGKAAGMAAGYSAGMALRDLISGGKEISSGYSKLQNIGTLVASYVNPVLGSVMGAVNGLVNRAFGMGPLELKSAGTRGTFKDTGFQGENYQNYHREGGWFRSDENTTDISAIDPSSVKNLSTAFTVLKKSMKDAVESLGLTADGFKNYSKYVDIASGTTAEGLANIFTGMADEMVQNLLGTTETITTREKTFLSGFSDKFDKVITTSVWHPGEFVKEGETASATILRLSNSLITVNTVFDFLGNKLLDVSLKGADAASKLADIFGGLENFTTATKTYYNTYYSEQERAQRSIDDMTKTFAKANITLPKTKEAFRDLVTEASKHLDTEEQRKAYALLISLAPEFAAAVDTLEKVKQSVVDLAKTAASAAMTVLSNAIKAQKEKLALEYNTQLDKYNEQLTSVTDNLSKLTSLANQLKSTLDGMRISGSEAEYRSAAQAQIQQALNTARSGGGLPLNGELTSALATVSKPSEQLFGSFEDYARDFYRTANNISDLSDITGAALTADQLTQSILKDQIKVLKEKFDADNKVLDDILTDAQKQIDIANGINTNILSVVDALKLVNDSIKSLNKATGEKEQAERLDSIAKYIRSIYDRSTPEAEKLSLQKLSDTAKVYGVSLDEIAKSMGFSLESVIALFKKFGVTWQTEIAPGYVAPVEKPVPTTDKTSVGAGGTPATSSAKYKTTYQLPTGYVSYDVVDPNAISRYDSINTHVKSLDWTTGNTAETIKVLADTAKAYGVSQLDLATASGYSLEDIKKMFAGQGIQSFDIGTNFVPNDMLANIHKGERIIPAADNSMLMQMVSQGSNNELKEELKDMKIQLKSALDKISDNTKQTRDILDNVTAGGSVMLTEVA